MLRYRNGLSSDPFYWLYKSPGWLSDYDPPRNFPFWINVEPTNRCQLQCFFCSRQTSLRPLGDLDLATAELIVQEAASRPECALRFTGWGEPLLHPRIADLAAMVKSAGLPLKIYTNGLALTPELMDHFKQIGVDDLQFSMQGLTPEQYEFNRQGSNYQRLMEIIEMASRRRGSAPRPFLSVLTSVLTHEAREGDVEAFMDHLLTLVDKVAVDLTNLNFVSKVDRVQPYLNQQSPQLSRAPCVDVFLSLEIKYDGLIQFCGQDADGQPDHSLGRVGEISLHQAWHSPKMNEQRDRVGRRLEHESLSVCRNCYHNTSKYDFFKKHVQEDL